MVAPKIPPAIELAPIASSKGSSIAPSNGFFSTVTRWTPRIVGAIVGILMIGFGNAAMALQREDSGPPVMELQRALTLARCYDGPMSDYFGELTEAAVIKCQRKFGLTPDGIAGPQTMAKLQGRSIEAQPWGGSANPPSSRMNSGTGVTQMGDSGGSVSVIQTKLKRLNLYTDAIDGVFGPRTEVAVRQFQQAVGLPINGRVGAEELTRLDYYGQQNVSLTPSPSRILLSKNQLAVDDWGSDVKHLQDRLREKGYFRRNPSTGNYQNETRDAVINFQRSQGFVATGVADPMTLQALGLQPGTQISQPPVFNPKEFTQVGSNTSIPQRAVAPNARYVVVIPKQNDQTFARVRRVTEIAQLFSSNKGDYIVVGSSPSRAWAENRSNYFRSIGFDARVDYQ
jgi:peptidoglycan hydrolase-like protein with peptidoglycan-binding domain